MSEEVVTRSKIDQAVAEIETAADAKRLHDELESLAQYAKRVGLDTDQQNEIARGKLLTIHKGGTLLNGIERAGGPGRGHKRPLGAGDVLETPLQRAYREAGLAASTARLWKGLSRRYPESELVAEINRLVADLTDALTLSLLINPTGGTKQSEHVEWYTPAMYIEPARTVMGGIDLDPASSEQANETVQATNYHDEITNGLEQEWHGRVWLNPPYGKGSGLFATKLVEEYDAGRTTAAILLLNAYGFDSSWFQPLWDHLICFTDHRVTFHSPTHKSGGPANGNIFIYLGPNHAGFKREFKQFGAIVRRVA